jgi:hypothetical protein
MIAASWHRFVTRATVAPAALVACVLLSGCGGSAGSRASAQTSPTSTTTAASGTATTTTTGPRRQHHRRLANPGSLPQTRRRPSAATPAFRAEMRALWNGIQTGSVRPAMAAFFPERAYLQLKTLYNSSADYAGRLVGDYRLDLQAAHSLLGSNAPAARLLRVEVERNYAHWVDPGVCDNRVGYWEVPNSRVVYREDGHVRSFGIASMISWRGVWYVVHLGAVVRHAAVGVVDNPRTGPGAPVASSTC